MESYNKIKEISDNTPIKQIELDIKCSDPENTIFIPIDFDTKTLFVGISPNLKIAVFKAKENSLICTKEGNSFDLKSIFQHNSLKQTNFSNFETALNSKFMSALIPFQSMISISFSNPFSHSIILTVSETEIKPIKIFKTPVPITSGFLFPILNSNKLNPTIKGNIEMNSKNNDIEKLFGALLGDAKGNIFYFQTNYQNENNFENIEEIKIKNLFNSENDSIPNSGSIKHIKLINYNNNYKESSKFLFLEIATVYQNCYFELWNFSLNLENFEISIKKNLNRPVGFEDEIELFEVLCGGNVSSNYGAFVERNKIRILNLENGEKVFEKFYYKEKKEEEIKESDFFETKINEEGKKEEELIRRLGKDSENVMFLIELEGGRKEIIEVF